MFFKGKKYILWLFGGIAAAGLMLSAYLAAIPTPKGFPILEYHMVKDEKVPEAPRYVVSTADFRAQLQYLKEQGYTTISTLDYLRAKKGKQELPEKPILLTFDDGYVDNYEIVLPILEEYGMKATVYVVSNLVGKKGYLSWEQIREMQARGIEIGCHTADHLPLMTVSKEEQHIQIEKSKLLIEWNGVHSVLSFSYPNGDYDEDIIEILKDANYLSAVSGDAGLNDFGTDPYQLQRVNIPPPTFGIWEFEMRLKKAEIWTKLGIFQHRINDRG